MKEVRPPKAMKASPIPVSKAGKAGQKVLSAYAHHAPTVERTMDRMERPHGGKGPHN